MSITIEMYESEVKKEPRRDVFELIDAAKKCLYDIETDTSNAETNPKALEIATTMLNLLAKIAMEYGISLEDMARKDIERIRVEEAIRKGN